jgi:hypothetical protein
MGRASGCAVPIIAPPPDPREMTRGWRAAAARDPAPGENDGAGERGCGYKPQSPLERQATML